MSPLAALREGRGTLSPAAEREPALRDKQKSKLRAEVGSPEEEQSMDVGGCGDLVGTRVPARLRLRGSITQSWCTQQGSQRTPNLPHFSFLAFSVLAAAHCSVSPPPPQAWHSVCLLRRHLGQRRVTGAGPRLQLRGTTGAGLRRRLRGEPQPLLLPLVWPRRLPDHDHQHSRRDRT